MDFDLAQLDTVTRSEAGVDMVVKQFGSDAPLINRKGEGVVIKLLGPDSSVYRTVFREQMKRRINDKPGDFDPDRNDAAALDMLVRCTVSWRGVLDMQGDEIPCTEDTVRKLYVRYPVIRAQVDAFISDRANFLLASSSN